jgi:hypothetical protein
MAEEMLLRGGWTNAGKVVRIGDTVRRPQCPTSAATHAVLDHLERVGFPGAPRFLGVDDCGREVLSFIVGKAAIAPFAERVLNDDALVSVAELLRAYHEAIASFDPAGHAWPPAVPPAFRDGTISHNDPNLDNVIFSKGRAVALVDFDLAGPGSAVWDVACAARLWAPLRHPRDTPEQLHERSLARLRIFVDAYGLPEPDRTRVADAVLHAHEWCYAIVRSAVADGHQTFGRIWHDGGRQRAARTRRWLAAHREQMRAALDTAPGEQAGECDAGAIPSDSRLGGPGALGPVTREGEPAMLSPGHADPIDSRARLG